MCSDAVDFYITRHHFSRARFHLLISLSFSSWRHQRYYPPRWHSGQLHMADVHRPEFVSMGLCVNG